MCVGCWQASHGDAEGEDRRWRWVSKDYAAFGAVSTASLVIRRHFQH